MHHGSLSVVRPGDGASNLPVRWGIQPDDSVLSYSLLLHYCSLFLLYCPALFSATLCLVLLPAALKTSLFAAQQTALHTTLLCTLHCNAQ